LPMSQVTINQSPEPFYDIREPVQVLNLEFK